MWTLVQTCDVNSPEPWTPRKTESGARPSREWLREQLSSRGNVAPHPGVPIREGSVVGSDVVGSTGLDQNTMKWRLWGTSSSCSVQDYSLSPDQDDPGEIFKPQYETLTGNKVNVYPSLYKLTQHEFRRLSEQVNELPPSGKFRGNGFKKYYTGGTGETVPVVYKTQLASSQKAFVDKGWLPYHNKHKGDPPTRCRPVGIHDRPPSRGRSSTPSNPQPPNAPRCRSAVGLSQRHLVSRSPSPTADSRNNRVILTATERSRQAFNKSLVDRPRQMNGLHNNQTFLLTGKSSTTSQDQADSRPQSSPRLRGPAQRDAYDTLTPELTYALSNGAQPESCYGDRPSYRENEGLWGTKTESTDSFDNQEDAGDAPTRKSKDPNFTKSFSDSSKDEDVLSSTSGVVSDRDSDDDSGEEPNEPNLDNIDINDLPNLNLRPEKLDQIYIPEYVKGDRRKYDFDINNGMVPAYEFIEPLSEDMASVDIGFLASKEHNWRHYTDKRPCDEMESNIIDRLIELERLQKKTQEWEDARKEKLMRQARLREAKSKIGSTVRHQSAKLRERKCCGDCLQLCCIGDCNVPPPQDNVCKLCDEYHPPGSCSEHVYTNRTRSERVSLDDDPPKPKPLQRPKSCHSCQRITSAKIINANNAILGRPKSGNTTFIRGQNNVKQPPRSASLSQITPEIERELLKLGINPQSVIKQDPAPTIHQPERPSTACSMATRGRAAIVPGKSYFSQRRTSLTDIAKSTRRIKSAAARTRQTKNKRPKTAS